MPIFPSGSTGSLGPGSTRTLRSSSTSLDSRLEAFYNQAGNYRIRFRVRPKTGTTVHAVSIQDADASTLDDPAAGLYRRWFFRSDTASLVDSADGTYGTVISSVSETGSDGYRVYELEFALPTPSSGFHRLKWDPCFTNSPATPLEDSVSDANASGELYIENYERDRAGEGETPGAVRPEWYGAIGDGLVNDAVAWATMLATGKPIELSAGSTYLLSGMSPYTGAGLRIIGNGATLQGNLGDRLLRPSGAIDVQGVRFYNMGTALSRLLTDGGTVTRFHVENCDFDTCDGFAGAVEVPLDHAVISGNRVINGGSGFRMGENTEAKEDTRTHVRIHSNSFKTLSASGSSDVSAIIVYGYSNTITGNTIEALANSGSGETWGIYTKSRFSTVTGNTVRTLTGAANVYGISIKGSASSESGSPHGFTTTVHGNALEGAVATSGTSGIRVQNERCSVSGNSIQGFTVGVLCVTDADYHNVSVTGNTISLCKDYAIWGNCDADAQVIANNTITGIGGQGIHCTGAGGGRGISITGNVLEGGGTSVAGEGTITFKPSADTFDVDISSNIITNCVNTYAMWIREVDGITIQDNYIDTPNIVDSAQPINFTTGTAKNITVRNNGGLAAQSTSASAVDIARLRIRDDGVYDVIVRAVGHDDTNEDAVSEELRATILMSAGGTTLAIVGALTTVHSVTSVATTGIELTANASEQIHVKVGGAAGATYNWRAELDVISAN